MPRTVEAYANISREHPDFCECSRCEIEPGVPFTWLKRIPGRPKRCPNCNSPRWNTPRRLPRRKVPEGMLDAK